ncbi:MAG: hypothetical protein WBJ54_12720 [Syntrophorhabdus sp.]|nr:hypothetical protein [Pseudomonadota bacterium]
MVLHRLLATRKFAFDVERAIFLTVLTCSVMGGAGIMSSMA